MPAQRKCKGQAGQQQGHRGAHDEVATFPVALAEIAATEKIVGHSSGKGEKGKRHGLIEKEFAIEEIGDGKEHQGQGGPGGDDPFADKLIAQQRRDGGGSETGEQNVGVQGAVAGDFLAFALARELRIKEEENQHEGKDGVETRTPEFAGLARSQIHKEDANEGGDERDVGLIAELGNLSQQAVLKRINPNAAQPTATPRGRSSCHKRKDASTEAAQE